MAVKSPGLNVMTLTLLERLQAHARDRGDAIAYHEVSPDGDQHQTFTFAELSERVGQLAARLRHMAPPGAVVLICYPNGVDGVVAYLATMSAGQIALLVNPQVAEPELRAAARQAGAATFLADGRAAQILSDPSLGLRSATSDSEDPSAPPSAPAESAASLIPPGHTFTGPGMMLLSSGTTGEPRIVFRDGPALDAVAANMVSAIGITPQDRVLDVIPICHSYGIEHGLLAPVYAGCTVYLCQRLDAAVVLDQLLHEAITVFPGVPSMFELLAAHNLPRRPRVLRQAYSAGAPLPLSVFEAFERSFGIRIGQLYGSTEAGSITFNNAHDPGHEPTSVGSPMSGVEIRILEADNGQVDRPLAAGEEGEVAVRAPSMLSAYVGDADPPFRDGFFMTGDLGRLDDAGRLTLTGRIKLLIEVGALKVNPLEVEAVLCRHPGVREAAVIPMPVTETISRLKAVIVPRDTDRDQLPEALRRFAREHLSAYKIPRVFELRDDLPRTPTGKLLRRQLS